MIRFVVVDLETTGSSSTDEIIQIGLVVIENGEITERFSSFVRPTLPIPPFISQLTGITAEMVADAPDLIHVAQQMRPFLNDGVFIAHNVGFDLGFVQRAFETAGLSPFDGRVLDTLDFTRMLFPGLPSYNLGMICESFGIVLENAHRADADAQATAEIWLNCLQRMMELPLLLLQRMLDVLSVLQLGAVTNGCDWPWFFEVAIEERQRMEAAGMFEEIVPKAVHRRYVLNVEDWSTSTDQSEAVEEDEDALSREEVLFQEFMEAFQQEMRVQLPGYEERPAQTQMIKEVWNAFRSSRHLVIEAGTGTGKSLAYMIPGLFFGILKKKKVIVSTHTIQLQEQLRQRDVPFLQSVFPMPFETAVLKGRNHYLCLRKFEQKINTNDIEPMKDDAVAAVQMLVWLSETTTGDEDEINFGNRGPEMWSSVASDSDSCLNRSCPWFRKCFYHRAKSNALQADLIITNHSLVMTDLIADHRLLPSYAHLVIDEAHQFEDVASKHLGIEISYYSVLSRMYRLYKDGRSGQVSQLRLALLRNPNPAISAFAGPLDEWCGEWVLRKEEWDRCCEWLYYLLAQSRVDGEMPALQKRLKADAHPARWNEFKMLAAFFIEQTKASLRQIEKYSNELTDAEGGISFDIQGLLTDLGGSMKQLVRYVEAFQVFAELSDRNLVYWLEANPQYTHRSLQMFAMPIDVSASMRQMLFELKESVVMTSATLTVDGHFQHFCEPIGLTGAQAERMTGVQLPSPFQYDQQALVCIPKDFPPVRGNALDQNYLEKLVQSLADVATEMGGRMLVLFTSYKMLRAVYGPLKEKLMNEQIQTIGQGVDSNNRTKLTRHFRSSERAVLLGTSSFWEGVDIPGEALSCLAIIRLPFQPPTHPIVEAKTEFLERNRKNPFMSYSVPQAVIRFKQGFGRLVRSTSDHGIVILYDTRVVTTQYGKYFLSSLPGPRIEQLKTEELVPRIRKWLHVERG